MTEAPPEAKLPDFGRTRMGYHPGEVDDFIARAVGKIRDLEQQLDGALRKAHRPPAERLIAELISAGHAELQAHHQDLMGELDAGRAVLASQAQQVLDEANAEAEKITAAAQDQAEQIIAQARAQASQALDAAHAAKAQAGSRVHAVAALHADAMDRLRKIAEVAGRAVAEEAKLAPLEEEVLGLLGG